MAIDLKKLGSKSTSQRLINPLEIWNHLDRSVGKEYLRPIQEQVLEQWFALRSQANVIIKMNTGTGKTLVGLLALQSCLHEGKGPALYICPDNFLVKQVLEQAKLFGVKCVSFIDSAEIPSDFSNGEAILVANCHKIFNGRSVFGIQGGSRPPLPVGAVVLDDAHACIEQIRSQFSINLGADRPAYGRLASLFASTLRVQRLGTFSEIESGDYLALMAVPFWVWQESHNQITSILSEYRESDELLFVWPFLRDCLLNCDCVISGTGLQVSARVPNIELIPSFASASRRIFLSATLLDDSQLVRDLWVPVADVRKQIKPNEFEDIGERLILIPQNIDRDLGIDFVRGLLEKNPKINRIVLVPSRKASERWQEVGAKAVLAENIQQALEPLAKTKGAFLVLIAKYDGVDLPDDVCRLLVLDSLPGTAGLFERYAQSVLLDSPTINAKIAQKIEQGLGRATRGKSDYCVVLVTGNDLVSFILNKKNRRQLSAGANTQIELGLAIGNEIQSSSTKTGYAKALVDEINRCLRRDDEWKAFYRSFLDGAGSNAGSQQQDVSSLEIAQLENEAAKLFNRRCYVEAEKKIQSIADKKGLSEREKGWFLQLGAAYLYPADKSRAMSMQKRAHEVNPFLFIPPAGIQYHRMSDLVPRQADLAIQNFAQSGNSNEFVIFCNAVCDRLCFGTDPELFEQALSDVARIIGIPSSRPENESGRGPDCLWQGEGQKFLVIEAKSGVDVGRREIHKGECEQLLHSKEWFNQEYPGKACIPILIHPGQRTSHEAVFPGDGRVVSPSLLGDFVSRIRAFVSSLASEKPAAINEKNVGQILQATKLRFAECFAGALKVS